MSNVPKIKEAKLDAARTDARLAIIGELSKLYERLCSEGKINQSRIAERLGVSRQYVSKLLAGPASNNWTLDKIGELLAAMDAEIARIDMKTSDEILPSNEFHSWLETSIKSYDIKHHNPAPSPPKTKANLETKEPVPPRIRFLREGVVEVKTRTSGAE